MFCDLGGFSRSLKQYSFLFTAITVLILGLFYVFDCHLEQEVSADEVNSLQATRFRIGKDAPLSAMQWYEGIDVNTAGIRRNTNFRVRFQVYNSSAESKDWLPGLEYLENGGTWMPVQSVLGTQPFFLAATGQFENEDVITLSIVSLVTAWQRRSFRNVELDLVVIPNFRLCLIFVQDFDLRWLRDLKLDVSESLEDSDSTIPFLFPTVKDHIIFHIIISRVIGPVKISFLPE